MITGTHAILYSEDAETDRAFLRDVLGLSHVDAGGGWLIFKLPPAEVGVHPADLNSHALYLTCDDIAATVAELSAKGVRFAGGVSDEGWGRVTSIALPGGGTVGLYEPRHPTAFDLPG